MAARSLLQLTERSNRSLFRRVTKPAEKHGSGLFFFSSKATYLQSVPFLSRTPPCFTCFCVKRKSYGLFSSCCNDQIILQPLKEVAQLPVGVCKKKKKKKRVRAVQVCCRASGGTPLLPGPCCWVPGSYLEVSCNLLQTFPCAGEASVELWESVMEGKGLQTGRNWEILIYWNNMNVARLSAKARKTKTGTQGVVFPSFLRHI